MPQHPLISIIIPAYNVAAYLPVCLDSAVSQTYAHLEIVVVNDGSTDNTSEIAHDYADRHSQIKVIDKQNEGLVLARKTGLDAAAGEYIMHLDGDDYIAADSVESLYNYLEANDLDIVCADLYRVTPSYRIEVKDTWNGVTDSETLLRKLLLHQTEGPLWNRLYKRELFQGLDHPAFISHGEDYIINLQIYQRPLRIGHLAKPLYFYVKRSDAITQHRLSFDYTVRFLEYAENLLQKDPDIYDKYQPHIVAMKVYYYYLYINRTSNPSVSGHPYIIQLYEELGFPVVKKLFREAFPWSKRTIIQLHRYPATAWAGKMLTTILRISGSLGKRLRNIKAR